MWGHLLDLLAQALRNLPWISLVLAPAILFFTLLLIWLVRGWAEMKRRWLENIGISALAVALAFLCLYAWSIADTVYKDHVSLVAKIGSLSQIESHLVNPASRDTEISKLKAENKRLRSEESPAVRVFPAVRDRRLDGFEMDYVLTTGKRRAPVQIGVTCDFPIADLHAVPLATSGLSFSEVSRTQSSPENATLFLQSPAWSPPSPLWVTILVRAPVNRTPHCRLSVQ